MSDQGRVAGKNFQTIDLGGKQYTLKPYVVGIWAEMSAFVRSLKGDPIKEVCDRLDTIPDDQQAKWMKIAVETAASQTPTDTELAAFEHTLMGTMFKLWSTLKADHIAEFPTPQSLMDRFIGLSEAIGEKKLAEIMLKLEIASGEADIKNFGWPARDYRVTPTDGDPMYGGWPAFYEFFFKKFNWTLEQVNECPVYLACILLGAIWDSRQGGDHVGVKMTMHDTMRYYGADEAKMQQLAAIRAHR